LTLTLEDLTRAEGIRQVVEATGGTRSYYNQPDKAFGLAEVAHAAIQRNPLLAQVRIRLVPNLPNAFYNYDKGEILLGITNPAVLAHEIEHAENIKQDSLYSNMLRVAEGISRLNNVAAIPVMLALRTFINDPKRRDDILKTLAGISAAIAAPGLAEETSATIRALKHNPGRRLEMLKTLGPAYLAHLARSMQPSLVYQAGRST
jgi:hypothetical protein